MKKSTILAAALASSALFVTFVAAEAARQPTEEQLQLMERAYDRFAFPADAQPVAELGTYACLLADVGGAETVVCGESITDPGATPFDLTYNECIAQGGNTCTYPWDDRTYCCGIQLGAPPRIE